MKNIINATTEEEFITMYTTYANEAMDYETNFDSYRQEMYD